MKNIEEILEIVNIFATTVFDRNWPDVLYCFICGYEQLNWICYECRAKYEIDYNGFEYIRRR